MGQSYVIANLDKKEFINPHDLGDGDKLQEFVLRENGPTNVAIALLLLPGQPWLAGGKPVGELIGSWYGNRIGIVGLYGEPLPGRKENLYDVITGMGSEGYANISLKVVEMVRVYLDAFGRLQAP